MNNIQTRTEIGGGSGARPSFRNFHNPKKVEGTEVPAENTFFLQRCETPLEPGTEHVIWFQFKVETPVKVWIALACVPWSSAARDDIPTLSAALGLKAS